MVKFVVILAGLAIYFTAAVAAVKLFRTRSKKTACEPKNPDLFVSDSKLVSCDRPVCSEGVNCEHLKHVNTVMHPCPDGESCTQLRDVKHLRIFVHSSRPLKATEINEGPAGGSELPSPMAAELVIAPAPAAAAAGERDAVAYGSVEDLVVVELSASMILPPASAPPLAAAPK